MSKPIAISLSPNSQKDDVLLALKLLFSPWIFFRSDYIKLVEQWFRQYFNVSFAIAFNSGRAALLTILKSFEIGKDDEVILQSFTCVAVPNAILALEAKPVYIDINENLTMDMNDLEKKITNKTKAIIFQYTFGIPENVEAIYKIAKRHKVNLIEDAAHIIGGFYKNKKLGTFGKVCFFSFGRDKAVSSTFGSIAITNDKEIGKKIRSFQRNLGNSPFFWIMQQLFHPIIFFIALPVYNILYIGKLIIIFFQKLHFLSFPVSSSEKMGKYNSVHAKKLSNTLACLAYNQLRKLDEFNNKRQEIARLYLGSLEKSNFTIPYKKPIPFLRFPILVKKRDEVMRFFQKNGVYLGRWYSGVIDPEGVNFEKIAYQKSSCPNALSFSREIINLPTYPNMSITDAKKIVELLKEYAKGTRDK